MTATTNGEYAAQRLSAARDGLAWARAHPDELAVLAAPYLAAVIVAERHRLPFPEWLLVTELGTLGGLTLLRMYQEWKARPVRPAAKLRGVR